MTNWILEGTTVRLSGSLSHKDLAKSYNNVVGGGSLFIDDTTKTVLLVGDSVDFGACSHKDMCECDSLQLSYFVENGYSIKYTQHRGDKKVTYVRIRE